MCISLLKYLFRPKEKPTTDSGSTEPVVVDIESIEQETGSTEPVIVDVESIEQESGSTEIISQPIELPPMSKPYEGINFHVLLDNGHASSTAGKRQLLENGEYFFEWEFNRDIVRRIALRLDSLGIPYEILVPETEKDIALTDRAARANSYCTKYGKDNCFFISVHSNAYGDGKTFTDAKGWSVWTTKGATKSDTYATIMFEEAEKLLPKYKMTTRKDMKDGDPDYEENFTVIYKTWCPAVLTENMFFTNKEEVTWLMTEEGKNAIADIHVNGIKRIINEG